MLPTRREIIIMRWVSLHAPDFEGGPWHCYKSPWNMIFFWICQRKGTRQEIDEITICTWSLDESVQKEKKWPKLTNSMILLMEEILHQLIGSLSHHLQGGIHPRWLCRMTWVWPVPRMPARDHMFRITDSKLSRLICTGILRACHTQT